MPLVPVVLKGKCSPSLTNSDKNSAWEFIIARFGIYIRRKTYLLRKL